MLMYALRVKSPEPPIPFIILVPHTWVELMLPKISASRGVLMVIRPKRRATSGLLEIFYCTTKIAQFFRFTSLTRSPTPPTDDRENTERAPT